MIKTSVVIIILTYNNSQDTLECLESVSGLQYASREIVLVDNHSTDGSLEIIEAHHPNIHYQKNTQNLGVAGGRNAGWHYVQKHFQCDYLFFLDNDTLVHPDSLGLLVACLQNRPEVGIVCGKTYTAPPSRTIMSVGMKINLYTGTITDIGSGEKDQGQYDLPRYVAACGGFAFLTRYSVFTRLKGLDNRYNPYGWEDVDFSVRLKKQGFLTYYLPQAIIYHKGCKIGRGFVPFYEKYKVQHYFLFLHQHTTWLQKVCCFFVIPFRVIFSILNLLIKGKVFILFSQLSGAFGNFFNRSIKKNFL